MKAQQSWGIRAMNNAEVRRFERILKTQHDEMIRRLDRLGDEKRSIDTDSPQDAGDRCVTSLSKESLFHEGEERRVTVRMIEAALARIQLGTFGICIACGDDINPRRLDALPWTPYCLRCQQALEQEDESGPRPDWADRRVPLRKAG